MAILICSSIVMSSPRLYNYRRQNNRYRARFLPSVAPVVTSGIELLPTLVVSTLAEIRIYLTAIFYIEDNRRYVRIQSTDLYHNALEPTTFVFQIPPNFFSVVVPEESSKPDSTSWEQ
jgi:hypothetical protein